MVGKSRIPRAAFIPSSLPPWARASPTVLDIAPALPSPNSLSQGPDMGQGPNHYQGFLHLPQQSHLGSRNICLTSSIDTQLLIVLTIRKKTGALNVNYIYLDSKNFIT